MKPVEAAEKDHKFVLPGRRLLALLVFAFLCVYLVVLIVERCTGVIGWGLFWTSIVAGVGFALPVSDRAFSFHARKVNKRWVPLVLTLIALAVSVIAVWVGIAVGVGASRALSTGNNVWEDALLGFEAFFAVISSLLLVDGWENVSLDRKTLFPPGSSQEEPAK